MMRKNVAGVAELNKYHARCLGIACSSWRAEGGGWIVDSM